MKKTLIFAVGLILLITGSSWGVQTSDFLNEHVVCLDSIPGTQGECDSAHIYVLFGNADYPCYMARTTDCGGSWIDSIDYAGRLHASYRFFDQVADVDCDSGAGRYEVIVTLFGSGVPTENSFSFELTDSSFSNALTRVGQINEDTKNLDAWNPITDNDSLIIDQSTRIVLGDTNTNPFDAGADSVLQTQAIPVFVATDGISAPSFADNAQYMNYGGVVWVDTTNGTAGTTVGVNGLPSLPCRGFEKAKIIADLIGTKVFCVLGGGDQSIKETMNGYSFVGMGDPTRNKIDLNSQDVGGCMFTDLDITGIQGGDRAAFVRCALEDVSIDAAAIQCGLRGDITLLGDRDNIFVGCASSVPGGVTPSLIFSGGSESVQFRGYSGGIHLYGMGANDTLSFEAIGGQLQVGAGVNVNAKITARGMITLTDSTAGLNNLTYEATAQFALDSTMNAITATNKANFKADVTNVTVGAFAADAIGAPAFADDAQFMVYGDGVWIGTGSNTNTVVGVDGLPTNPVSTIAAAKTIADAIGSRTIYFMDGVDKTLAATMEYYHFVGTSHIPSTVITFGGQDVDNSRFDNVQVTGTLGGTGRICIHNGALVNVDSLCVHAFNSLLAGKISLRSNGVTDVFADCYSGVAGDAYPILAFETAQVTTEDVVIRGYKGELRIVNLGASDSLSFDSPGGKIVFSATCNTGAIVNTYGMISIVDSTAGMSNLTYAPTAQYAVDSTMNAITDANKANFKATDLSVETDSILAAIYDRTNDTSFIRILSQYVLKHLYPDSVIIDNSAAWDLSGGTDLSDEVDSLLAAIYDRANDTSFVRIITQYVLKHLYPDSVTIDNSNAWDLRFGVADTIHHMDSILTAGVSASCFGSGARTVNIDVMNAADSTGILGFRVDVYDSSAGTFVDRQNTDVNGRTTWSLDDDVWTVHLSSTGWSITTPQYLTVSGDATQTYYATEITVTPPPTDSVCVVYGYIKDRSGVAIRNAKVKMWIPEYPVKFHDVIINALTPYEVKTDSDGKFEFSLGFYPNSLLTPSGTLYMFRVESAGFRFEKEIEVPLADSYEVSLDL